MQLKEDVISDPRKTEIIAFCSGKGGTGKSLLCACFGYALLRGGQRVLMIDGDPATNGLSLFLLGPKGQEQIGSFDDQSTFSGALERFQKTGSAHFEPRPIHRRGDDHRVTYTAIISGRGLYGEASDTAALPDLNRGNFRAGVRHLFDQLRSSGDFDYVLVDTRGGASFESTDLGALADSYIVVTEPDENALSQDRNVVSRIAATVRDVEASSRLRAVIVNKAADVFPEDGKSYLDTLEVPFRNQLVQGFSVHFEETYPIPVSRKALLAYKANKIPYRSVPESIFCMATLAAFTEIVGIVDAPWTEDQIDRWNVFVDTIDRAVTDKQASDRSREQGRAYHEEEFQRLRATVAEHELTISALGRDAESRVAALHRDYEIKVAGLEQDLHQRNLLYEHELSRAESLTATLRQTAGNEKPTYDTVPAERQAAIPVEIQVAEPVTFNEPITVSEPSLPSETAWTEEEVEVEEARPASPSRAAFASFVNQANTARNGSSLVGAGLFLLFVTSVVSFFFLHRNPNKTVAAARAAQPAPVSAQAPAVQASPLVQPEPTALKPEPPSQNNFAVLLAGGKALTATEKGGSSAAYEAQLALRSGYAVQVYQRAGRYTAVVPWETRSEADESIKEVQTPFSGRWASTSAVVALSDWCPERTAQNPLVVNNKEVPVWTCGSSMASSSKARTLGDRQPDAAR